MTHAMCQFHVWAPGTGLVSHTSYIGDYDGPYRFSDGTKVGRAVPSATLP